MKHISRSIDLAIITVHKGNIKDLIKTVKSIDSQIIKPKKHIIICTEKEFVKLNYLKKKNRQFVINQDKSIYDAMNIGIKKARGLHKLFLNSNDILYSNLSLQQLEKYLILNKPIIAVTSLRYENLKFEIKKKEFEKKRYMPHSSFVAPRTSGLNDIFFNTKINIAADGIWMKDNIKKSGSVIKIYKNISLHTLGGISTSPSLKTIFYQFKYRKSEGLKELLKFIIYSIIIRISSKSKYYLIIYKRKYIVKR